jgi:NAD(P)-dependent dehydrogenase (short-subunit alcohol dehydrogenase family)
VLAQLGGLDILVNNAGILIEKPLLDTSADDFDRLIGVNLRGVFLVGREAIRVMARQGEGRVINIASELAYLGRANCSAYCASKGGVLSMTRSWAREFAPHILVQRDRPRPDGHGHANRRLDLARDARSGSADSDRAARTSGGDRERGGVPGRARRDVHHRAMPQPERRRRDVLSRPQGRRSGGHAGRVSSVGPCRSRCVTTQAPRRCPTGSCLGIAPFGAARGFASPPILRACGRALRFRHAGRGAVW